MCTVLVKYVISHVYDITMPVISLGREVLMSTKSWTQEIIPDPKEITAPGVLRGTGANLKKALHSATQYVCGRPVAAFFQG